MTSSVSNFGRDHGLIHEAVVTGRKAGWTADEWSKLAHSKETMRDIRGVLLGHAEIVTSDVIDCNADPFVPDGWSVEEHQKGGTFKWNAANVALYLSEDQKNSKWIKGNKLRKALVGKPVLNANVLDYLLTHPHLIPEEWKSKAVFFWGTIYRSRGGHPHVRYLLWYIDRWDCHAEWIDLEWHDHDPAALLAS